MNTSTVNTDQAFYDHEPLGSTTQHARWMREIEFYFDGYAQRLDAALRATAATAGQVAELGAGSCGLSICLSRLPHVQQVHALDISAQRMDKMLAASSQVLGGEPSKVRTVACDFNQRLPFGDESLDAVLFDASLHHARSMWFTLKECHRVLRPGGVLVAQREAYLSPLRFRQQLTHLLQTPEVLAQVSENIYLKEQYLYYLRACGFAAQFFHRTPSKVKHALRFLSGWAFTDGILFCTKTA